MGMGDPYPSNDRNLYGCTHIRVRWTSYVFLFIFWNPLAPDYILHIGVGDQTNMIRQSFIIWKQTRPNDAVLVSESLHNDASLSSS